MAHANHLAKQPALNRWLLVALTLLGFLGQLLIGNQARPDETPRATIQRLTGIDIAAADHAPVSDTAPHVMHMPGMTSKAGQARSHAPGHHHDGSCPLCPLLHLPVIVLTGLIILPRLPLRWAPSAHHLAQPRAPPSSARRILPPSRGPPSSF
jgi:hypothetical protein